MGRRDRLSRYFPWIPAFAGMTRVGSGPGPKATSSQVRHPKARHPGPRAGIHESVPDVDTGFRRHDSGSTPSPSSESSSSRARPGIHESVSNVESGLRRHDQPSERPQHAEGLLFSTKIVLLWTSNRWSDSRHQTWGSARIPASCSKRAYVSTYTIATERPGLLAGGCLTNFRAAEL